MYMYNDVEVKCVKHSRDDIIMAVCKMLISIHWTR